MTILQIIAGQPHVHWLVAQCPANSTTGKTRVHHSFFTIPHGALTTRALADRYRATVKSRSHGLAPTPAELIHLRPTDAAGLRVIGLALTGAGVALSMLDGWVPWAAGQLLLAVMLVQWFVILHECGHETLFRTRRYHLAAGRLAAFFSLIPYHAWTRVHGRHHKWTGWQDLDPTTASLVPRPLGRGERAIVNICWRLWIPLFSRSEERRVGKEGRSRWSP